ncbi:MAG: flagellar hook-associated protein 3 [Lachnospiraceae bacterium]|jgi:flagellar hook-associated protein 3 FlgL|nr:flagellar hook-associated protein 3 [Lachnospiraceae bacterium]
MRITNKIIQNNAMSNININKQLEDKYNTQMSTGAKISRPSDDPVIAIRALRLRTNLSQVTQYYEKNVPDATSWLKVTEASISTTVDVLTEMNKQCVKGSVGYDTAQDRQKILESLQALRDEIYSTGDADYAGRYVFTGYRTDLSLSFATDAKKAPSYKITEQLSRANVEDITYVDVADLDKVTTSDIGTTMESQVSQNTIHRIRLAYDNCDETAPVINYSGGSIAPQVMSINGTDDPYMEITKGTAEAIFIPETGEILLNDASYAALQATIDDVATQDVDEGEIAITYEKSKFVAGDLRPEHFYYCETTDKDGTVKKYNEEFLDPLNVNAQIINYDVGYNQTVRVNTLAKEVYTLDMGRDVDELVTSIQNVIDMEAKISDLKALLKRSDSTTDPTATQVQERLDAANKAGDMLKDKMQKDFEKGITKTQAYIDRANVALTATGNRQARVDLVANRLSAQQTSFKELTSDNEDADITEVAINLSSVELSYQAALMATGKIAQTTLLNYL